MSQGKSRLTLQEVEDQAAKFNPDDLWSFLHRHAVALHPLWLRAVTLWTDLAELDEKSRRKHINVATKALDLMDDWRFGRRKLLTARRNEIYRCLTFTHNKALARPFHSLPVAPMIYNLTSFLNSCTGIATRETRDADFLRLVPGMVCDLAAVRTFLPAHLLDLGMLAVRDDVKTDDDALELAGQLYGLEDAIESLYAEAEALWLNKDDPNPEPMILDPEFWIGLSDGTSIRIHRDIRSNL